jgi:hypothetical protein
MGKMAVMRGALRPSGGHATLEWTSGDTLTEDVARREFDRAVNEERMLAFEGRLGQGGEMIRAFNPQAEDITLVPAMMGG